MRSDLINKLAIANPSVFVLVKPPHEIDYLVVSRVEAMALKKCLHLVRADESRVVIVTGLKSINQVESGNDPQLLPNMLG